MSEKVDAWLLTGNVCILITASRDRAPASCLHFLNQGWWWELQGEGGGCKLLSGYTWVCPDLRPNTEKAMATHSSTLAWKIPWTEEPGRLQSMGSRRAGHLLSDFTFTFHFHALEKEIGNPLQCSCLENPRDGGAWWAAVYGSHRVGHDWSDLAAAARPNNQSILFQRQHSDFLISKTWSELRKC